MKKVLLFCIACIAAMTVFTFTSFAADDEKMSEASAACLECHASSFAELAEMTADYVDAWGEPVNPHTYVDEAKENPHAADKIVPDCTRCHVVHPEGEAPSRKGQLTYCYACHHEETFEKCSSCH